MDRLVRKHHRGQALSCLERKKKMLHQSMLQQAIEYNFRFQQGGYFDGRRKIPGAVIFFSQYIKDVYWNYAVDITATSASVSMVIESVEREMKAMKRQPAFYLTPWTEPLALLQAALYNRGYQKQYRDAWMFFSEEAYSFKERQQALTTKIVSNSSEEEDFFDVFRGVYVEERVAIDEPYANLSPAYITALQQSFSTRNSNTCHFLIYTECQPVAIGSLICADGWGGLYNFGTLPSYRSRGIGSQLACARIEEWKKRRGHTLFLQTEAGSKNEKFHSRFGFKTLFIGECWARVLSTCS